MLTYYIKMILHICLLMAQNTLQSRRGSEAESTMSATSIARDNRHEGQRAAFGLVSQWLNLRARTLLALWT